MKLDHGVYDSVVTKCIVDALSTNDVHELSDIDPAEAPEYYARLVAEATKRAIETIPGNVRVLQGAQLANSLIEKLDKAVAKAKLEGDLVISEPKPQLLTAVSTASPTGEALATALPMSPLSQTSLLTNTPKEPNLENELKSEIDSANDLDILSAFITFTGVRSLIDYLRRLIERGGTVRVITTTFTGTTQVEALRVLRDAGAQIRVSYDRSATRLHAKAWLFRRNSGFSTAYIGSSNLTHHAQVTGIEWNVRASAVTNPGVVNKFTATFESYWNDGSFVPFDEQEFNAERNAANRSTDQNLVNFAFLDLQPRTFQEGILEKVQAERDRGYVRNLIVAATGTGKTVMAAIDYRRLRQKFERSRLLFVAHRREILQQSLATFRVALKDGAFGELWVAGQKPSKWEHVFASVQSLNAGDMTQLVSDHFDVIIVDEFHHAEAPSYKKLLEWYKPKQLLGLTATPERADGLDVLAFFDGRIAAELRLWDALSQNFLSPFHYFGIADGTDLSTVPWRGGYDSEELTNVYTRDDVWISKVVEALRSKVANPAKMRALGFCVSVRHAEHMAKRFREVGLNSVSVTGNTPRDERENAVNDLRNGDIQIVFAVDVFNEGVDLPEVDTILFLRPTESATIFLQQLGRGLRRTDENSKFNKDVLTVLDFVGNQRKEFRFDQRFRKLLGGSRAEVEKQIEQDFPFLPAGCSINLDAVSKEAVLKNIRAAIPTGWVDRKRESVALGDVSLAEFLEATGLELADVYSGKHSYTELRRCSGFLPEKDSEQEQALGRAIARMLHINDPVRLQFLGGVLSSTTPPKINEMNAHQLQMLTMLHYTLWGVDRRTAQSLESGFKSLWMHNEIREEMFQVVSLLEATVVEHNVVRSNCLQLHASYARDEVLAAFECGCPEKPPQVREGVKWLSEHSTDLLFITLNKSEKDYSPSTMYRDYATSRELFHWESQSNTTSNSKTGNRYINHEQAGSKVMIFVREHRKDARRKTMPYVCLGLATYVSHTGERPMAITWKLDSMIPVDIYTGYRAAAA